MSIVLNTFPDNWTAAPFTTVMSALLSFDQLRSHGLTLSSGEDELGQFEQAVLMVNGQPAVIQKYTAPEQAEFFVELPLDYGGRVRSKGSHCDQRHPDGDW